MHEYFSLFRGAAIARWILNQTRTPHAHAPGPGDPSRVRRSHERETVVLHRARSETGRTRHTAPCTQRGTCGRRDERRLTICALYLLTPAVGESK